MSESTDIPAAGEDAARLGTLAARADELADRLQLALEAGELGVWRWDLEAGTAELDETVERLFGFGPGEFDGTFQQWQSRVHPDDLDRVLAEMSEVIAKTGTYVVEHRVVWPDGTVRWIGSRGQVTVDDRGEAVSTIGVAGDITARKLVDERRDARLAEAVSAAERERADRRRFEFFIRIADALGSSSTEQEVMDAVAQAAVPDMADWCVAFLRDPRSGAVGSAVAHADPEQVRHARELQRRFPFNDQAHFGAAAVMRTGRTEYYPTIPKDAFSLVARDEDELEAMRSLDPRSIIVAPIRMGDTVLGALQFARADRPSVPYTEDDVAVAEAGAARVAAMIANLRLVERQREIATTLQQSLLPDVLPEIPGVQLAVRYWAAGEATEVGGDFYDVFPIDADRWAIAIGDVCGTGPTAAGITSVARHTIRAAATHDQAPLEVLRWLNDALRHATTDLFCTAAYATLRSSTDSTEGWELTTVSGGHPLPILTRADGTTGTVGGHGTLLGVFEQTKAHEQHTTLRPGDTLVLYTDGVTDVPRLGLTTEALCAVVGAAATRGATADEVMDLLGEAIAAQVPIAERHDDIALIVLRVTG